MATYFHGNTEMQGNGDGLQTLIFMNPAYVGYSDNHHHQPPPPPPSSATSFTFLNSSSSATAVNHSHPPLSQIHHLTGIPLQAAAASSPQYQDVSELHGGSIPRFHYNLHNPLMNYGGAAREVTRAKQGLSLSLSSQQPTGAAPSQAPEREAALPGAEEVRVPSNVLLSCKYLKVAQELLDEVVNIGKDAKNGSLSSDNGQAPKNTAVSAAGDVDGGRGDGRAKRGAELTTAEKQEIQMKRAKLINMLDEVEQRYKLYQHEMQMVICWLEQAAGVGSARTYTALALQTISKQFRCLKDAILAQIRVASKKLGEDKMEVSRLKYIDSQRGLQQLGMIQQNAWRPQRGLPERSVSVLRAWLFEHFLHPYPKDTDKIMLAKQTGLTRSQVSNWFINARVRLWKPMVEEMYAEEVKGHQGKTTSENEIAGKTKQKNVPKAKEPGTQIQNNNYNDDDDNTSSASPVEATTRSNVGFNLIGASEMDRSPKKLRNADIPSMIVQPEPSDVDNQHMSMKFTITGAPTNFFASYPMMGLQQFQPPYSGNGVSLTLGLQHCENLPNQNFMSNQSMHLGRGVEAAQTNDFAHSMGVYDNIDVQNSKRFAAQLLPDFVT